MLTLDKLRTQFHPVDLVDPDLVRCTDELPATTIHTYVRLGDTEGATPFVVSADLIDDDFAALLLQHAGSADAVRLGKRELVPNHYGFTHLLEVPPHYHGELKGRFDAERARTKLCIPIFDCEFTGDETPEAFQLMRGRLVPTSCWDRSPSPKISLRFDNPKTGGGTGERTILAPFDQVLREIGNLAGVDRGFIELHNHRGEIVELVAHGSGFGWIEERNDVAARPIDAAAIRDAVWAFVTR